MVAKVNGLALVLLFITAHSAWCPPIRSGEDLSVVLITGERMFFFVTLFFISTALYSQSELYPSGLIQYGENIDDQRLELLEDRQVIRLIDFSAYSMDSTYIIRNSGEAYQTTLGIMFVEGPGEPPNPSKMGLSFTVDGIQMQYTERNDFLRFVMSDVVDNGLSRKSTGASINVLFPENSTVTIQVQYQASPSAMPYGYSAVHYNETFETIPLVKIGRWRGPTEFSLEIINESQGDNSIETCWIGNIRFFHAVNSQMDINMRNHLLGLQSLETDLMRIQRPTGNSVKIYFTEQFMNNYHRSFSIEIGFWEDAWYRIIEWSPEGFVFAGCNITQRELAPYELVFLTNNQLRVIRNAFYARHGFVFNSTDLQDMFGGLEYYYPPNPDFTEDMLTETDRANIATIQRLEALAGE